MRRLLDRDDLGRLAAYLLRNEADNTFILGNLLYYGVEDDRRTFRRGDYWGYFSGSELTGVCAMFNNSQCMVHFTDEGLASPMASLITGNPVRLVMGPERCVKPLLPMLRGQKNRIVPRNQLFMECAGGNAVRPVYAGAEFEDARKLAGSRAVYDFIGRCMKEGFGFSVTRGSIRRMLAEKTEFEPYLLMKVRGKYVSQAHIQARTPSFCQIGGVCTLPEERRRGYAAAVLLELMRMIPADGGRRPSLVVDEDNSSARQLYESLGFRESKRLMLIDFY